MESSPTQLTRNGVRKILEEGWGSEAKPVIAQIIEVKNFDKNDSKKNIKVRVRLSDGCSYAYAMMESNAYEQLDRKPLESLWVIRITGCFKQIIQNRNIIIFSKAPEILYTDIIQKIGNPKEYEQNSKTNHFDETINLQIPRDGGASVPLETSSFYGSRSSSIIQPVQASSTPSRAGNTEVFIPVKALTTFNYDWKIKARVTKKGEIRQWKNPKSEGYLLSIDLIDQDGTQIQATFFKEAVDKFASMIEEGKTYSFANGSVKISNPKFTSIKNDFSITFDSKAEIKEVSDDPRIPENGFCLVSIGDIFKSAPNKTVDVMGVVMNVSQPMEINLKNGGNTTKRSLVIADDSGLKIEVTFWRDQTNFQVTEGSIVTLKNVRIHEFQGKSLNSGDNSQLIINPDHPRARDLRRWFTTADKAEIKSISKSEGTRGKERIMMLGEIDEYMKVYNPDIPPFFLINGFVSYARCEDSKAYYLACTGENCKKKVIEDQMGYRCESCDRILPDCNPSYILQGRVDDSTDCVYLTFYKEAGDIILGITATELKSYIDTDNKDQVAEISRKAKFKKYSILIKGQFDSYNGENRLKYRAIRVNPYEIEKENQSLLERLEMYEGMN